MEGPKDLVVPEQEMEVDRAVLRVEPEMERLCPILQMVLEQALEQVLDLEHQYFQF